MDRIAVNHLDLVLKDAKKVVVVTDDHVLIVDVTTSTIQDVTGKDVLIGYYCCSSLDKDVYVDILDKGVANTALCCLYSRGIG